MEIKNTDQIMRADIMLARIQDKNELANAGDIYVGTGNAPDVVDASVGEDGKVAKPTVKNIQTAVREDANRQQGLRLGEGTSSSYSNIVELGIGAKAEANGACQIGAGTNNVANSLQFRDKTVVNGNGEIVGDYPLGFTRRQISGWSDLWPKFHSDLKDGTIVTNWAFQTKSGYNSEIAFVSTEDAEAQGGNLNIVIDGDMYVKNGQKKVYAEGDVVDQAKQADYPTGFTKRQTSVLDDGWPKNHSDLVDGTVVTDWCYDKDGNANIAFVKTYDSTAQTPDLNLVVDGNIYVEEGLRRVYAEGDIVEKAAYALKTSFSNTTFKSGYPLAIILTESGTYQFYYEPLAFSCLLYYNINSLGRSSVFVSPRDIVVEGETQISQNEKFYMQIGSNGTVNWFKENVRIDGFEGTYSVSSSWTDFNPLTLDKKVYYRKIN